MPKNAKLVSFYLLLSETFFSAKYQKYFVVLQGMYTVGEVSALPNGVEPSRSASTKTFKVWDELDVFVCDPLFQ